LVEFSWRLINAISIITARSLSTNGPFSFSPFQAHAIVAKTGEDRLLRAASARVEPNQRTSLSSNRSEDYGVAGERAHAAAFD
jgi:hypothetical protein